jgi:serine/threonine protein kinase
VDGILGAGVAGCVKRGMYKGKDVAIKVMHPGSEVNPGDIEAFTSEVQVLMRCDHPNIVQIFGSQTVAVPYFLVEELARGSLADVLYPKDGTNILMPIHQVLVTGIHVSNALSYLHPTVIHRDLKPANILINVEGVCKVSDFSLARMMNTATLKTLNPEVGTVQYMAPELFDPDNNSMDCRSDIYSLGVILWELVSGTKPWLELSMMQIIMTITSPEGGVFVDRLLPGRTDVTPCPLLVTNM